MLEKYLERALDAASKTTGVEDLAAALRSAALGRRTIFTCGNGGSFANALHLAQDLDKGAWVPDVPRLRTHCLGSNPSGLTAWANDEGYDRVFSEPLRTLGRHGDLLIAFSGSGNSENVITATNVAKGLGLWTWGVTGFDGGKLRQIAHGCVHVPCDDMGMVEVIHDGICHYLVDDLRAFHETLIPDTNAAGTWCPRAGEM